MMREPIIAQLSLADLSGCALFGVDGGGRVVLNLRRGLEPRAEQTDPVLPDLAQGACDQSPTGLCIGAFMSDANSAPAVTVPGEAKVGAALNALWIGGAAAPEPDIVARAFELIVEAAKSASRLWPEFYEGAGAARLVHSAATPLPAEVAEAALRRGLIPTPFALTPESGAEQCDLAFAFSAAAAKLPATLPVLSASSEGGDRVFEIADGDSSLLPGVRRWSLPKGAASPSDIARALLSPPRTFREATKLRDYQSEDMGAAPRRYAYDVLLRLIGEKAPSAAAPDHSWEAAATLAQKAGPACAATIAALRAEYQRADAQALAYGQRWRSTLATRAFMLLLGSVMSGLVGTLFPWLVVVTVPIQVFATGMIFADRWFATHRRWREKWVEYRRLAEAARIARLCTLAGAPFPGAHSNDWLDWRLQRAIRSAPPAGAVREESASDTLDHLRRIEIGDQIAYHHSAFRRFRRLDARLKRAATIALFSTVAVGFVFAVLALTGRGSWTIPLTSSLSLALSAAPGLYAALDGLRGQLDVTRQAQRSGRIAAGLRRLARELADIPPSAALARAAALRAANIMGEDVMRWERVVGVV
jgi:hypothetical protein